MPWIGISPSGIDISPRIRSEPGARSRGRNWFRANSTMDRTAKIPAIAETPNAGPESKLHLSAFFCWRLECRAHKS